MDSEISKDRIGEILKKLESFGTRHTFSDTLSETRGISSCWTGASPATTPGSTGEIPTRLKTWPVYAVVMRETTAPDWQKEFWVGNTSEFVLPNVSIDVYTFGVKRWTGKGTKAWPPLTSIRLERG